jgi:hypothetical protein
MRAVSSGTGGNGCERSDIGGLRMGTRSTPPLARTLPTSPIVSGPFYNAPAEPWCKNGRFCTIAQQEASPRLSGRAWLWVGVEGKGNVDPAAPDVVP